MKSITVVMMSVVCIIIVFACMPKVHASDVTIQNTSTFVSSIGALHIVGEVQNNGADSVDFVKIVGTFYNQSHVMVGTDYAYTLLDTLMPGAKSPFELLVTESALVAQITSYSLTATCDTTNPKPPGLEILSNSSRITTLNYYEVIGEIQNLRVQPTTYVQVIATFYNSTGAVVGCDYAFSDPSGLQANETAPFKITFIYDEVVPQIFSYQLTAESQEYSMVPEYPNITLLAMLALAAITAIVYKRPNGKIKIIS